MMVYERVEPVGRCVNPDGHEHVEMWVMCSAIPDSIVCPSCGKPWGVVTFDDGEVRGE